MWGGGDEEGGLLGPRVPLGSVAPELMGRIDVVALLGLILLEALLALALLGREEHAGPNEQTKTCKGVQVGTVRSSTH